MKKVLLAALTIFGVCGAAGAAGHTVWKSSQTATADTTKNLCMNKRGMLHSVCISSASTAGGGNVTIFASSATTANQMTTINSSTLGCYTFDVIAATNTGISYSTVGTAVTTILYDCY